MPGVVPPNVKVLIATFGVNPVPVTVTRFPPGPAVGERVSPGVVILKRSVSVSDPPSFPVAATV